MVREEDETHQTSILFLLVLELFQELDFPVLHCLNLGVRCRLGN